jgi:peptide methionine sulfoxide reductase MsrB
MSDVIKSKRGAVDHINRQEEKKRKENNYIGKYDRFRMKVTEIPFTSKNWNHKHDSVYACLVCANELFETKFDSGICWPSSCVNANMPMMKFVLDSYFSSISFFYIISIL